METNKQIAPWIAAVAEAEHRFVAMTDQRTWEKESLFAMQAVMKNDYLKTIANQNPQSLRNAVANVAAIGITLNPALAYAYLVPRDKQACLDISYKGLIKIATDTGAIKWCQAELVYSNDLFEFHGPTVAPVHNFNPFAKDRGEFQGAYCVAKTADGDLLVEAMSAQEIHDIRDKTDIWKKSKSGPWKDFPGEMAKKTVIKRASKTWPKSTGTGRLEQAIELLNQQGEGVTFEQEHSEIKDVYTIEQKERFEILLNCDDPLGMFLFEQSIPRSAWIDLYNSGEQGKKQTLKKRVNELTAKGFEIVEGIRDAVDRGDELGLAELIEGCEPTLLAHLPAVLGADYAPMYVDLMSQMDKAS